MGSFATGNYDNKRIFFQQFLNPDATPTGVDSTQRQRTDNVNRTWTLRLDYTKPLKKWLLLSTGASGSRSAFHNILNTDVLRNSTGDYFNNPLLSNDFWFYQDVYTARAAFTIDLPRKWRIVGGAQAENTRISFAFKEVSEDYANDYWNVLPNFTLRKEWLGSGWSSSIIYRKSIRRPGIGQLNPSIDYNNPYNLRFGNPVLLPQLAKTTATTSNATAGTICLVFIRIRFFFWTIKTCNCLPKKIYYAPFYLALNSGFAFC